MGKRTVTSLAALAVLFAATALQADIVAVKRSAGLTVDHGLHATFKAAIAGGTVTVYSDPSTGQDMADDAILCPSIDWAAWRCYANYGATAGLGSVNYPILAKFNLSVLPNFAGGQVVRAELRFYYGGGNTGLTSTGYITSYDWAEGNKNEAYPGVAPAAVGCSFAHPQGLNTNQNQDANGGTTGPLKSWAGNDWFDPAKDSSALTVGRTCSGYPNALPDTTNPSYDGFAVMDVTPIVQVWADGTPNYGFVVYHASNNYTAHLSETAVGSDFQPLLIIQYLQNDVPAAVTDLATSNVDWYRLTLRWTAPNDVPPGPVASYNIRYSTVPINDANFDAAAAVPDIPAPAAPGTLQTLNVTGLAPSTPYYFAMKSLDRVGLVSAISNIASAITIPQDAVAPAAVFDLTITDTKPNYVDLRWTAPGDDGSVGVAAGYELRYSNAPIDEGNFGSATLVPTAAPKVAGSIETITIHGLTPSTTYYFAIKARDEVPNWAPLSNVPFTITLAEDLLPPVAVSDLRVVATHIHSAVLVWTAPADLGSAGCASYDVRYSTSPIDDGNWDAATQATGEPAPAAPGATERFTVLTGLAPETTYYFALKTADWAEPANVSALSNVASGETMPPVQPVTVRNPWIVNDRVADPRNISTMGATYKNAYTPNGVVLPASDEDKAINIYNNQKRRLYHWADEPPNAPGTNIDDPIYTQNVFGWCLCGRHATQACTIVNAAGLTPRKIGLPGHWIYEVQYGDATYHAYDTMTTMYLYNRANPRKVASCAEIKADNSLMLNAYADGRACPGFLLCGDTAEWFAGAINSYSPSGSGVITPTWSMNMDLRMGESFKRSWEAWQNQHPTPRSNADSMPGNDPPYHHECQNDWKDTVNFQYWEPYGQVLSFIHTGKATYRRWANGTYDLKPDFRSAGYQAMVYSSTGIATFNDDGLTPDLHVAAPGTPGEVVFKIKLPFYITDANISGDFLRNDAGDLNRIYFSANGTAWTQVWDNTATGLVQLSGLSLRNQVLATFEYYVKVQLSADGSKTDAGVSNLVISTIFEHNKGCMAYLDKGVNQITVTLDNPADLATGAAFKVTYKWKEFDGANWTVDRLHEQYISASPTTFTITVGGTRVPRTESILMEVTEPPMPDGSAPAPVTDLAAVDPDATRVDLTWTASGDDYDQGQATSYDIRYSTLPITAENFDAATAVANPPAPKPAGQAERFTVPGLQPNTLYYFALKVRDEGGNLSEMSNMASATTLPPDITPPAAIVDLRAQAGAASGSIQLSWTASGDDGTTGKATAYEIRCSPNPITAANFAAATLVANPPTPQPAGQAEDLPVTGLTWKQRYYFAILVRDEAVNTSGLSNVAHAKASGLGIRTLQVGLDGYTGVLDSYFYVGAPTTNYSTLERMTVCGYGASENQRGILKFDLSSLPPSITLTQATLSLYAYNAAQCKGSTGFYGVYPVTRTWTDSQTTWNSAASGVAWTTPGGDFLPTADGTAPKQAAAAVPCWYSFDVTARAQAWLAGPSSNNGWVVKCTNENLNNQDYFYQSDTVNALYRPKLVVSDAVVPLEGDVDDDGDVDVFDVIDVVLAFGSVPGDAAWVPGADFDGMGSVDIFDVILVINNFGATR